MAAVPNITNGAKKTARVRTRQQHHCIVCGKMIRKGIEAKTAYAKELGQVWAHTHHGSAQLVADIRDLVGVA